MTSWSQAVLIARLRLLDAARDRRAFLTSLLLPLVMVAAFGVLGGLGARQQKRSEETTLKVAVAESTRGADALLASLKADGIKIVRTSQPAALVVRDRVDISLTVPPDADASLASGRGLHVEILAGTGGRAVETIASTEAALERIALEAGARRIEVRVTADRLVGNKKAVASALARTVPLLALVITFPFLSSGVRALTNTRADRSIEHLLPLPVSRTTLLLGLALGTIGGEAIQQILLLGLLAIAAPTLAATGAIPWTGPPILALALVISALTAGSLGVLIGVVARSDRIVGMMFGVTGTVLFATATALQFIDKPPQSPGATAIPLLGPVLACRAAFTSDGVALLAVLTMVAGGIAAIFVVLQLASRRLANGGGLRV